MTYNSNVIICYDENRRNDYSIYVKVKEKDSDTYQKTAPGMGMHVDVKDPDQKVNI